MNYSEEIEKVRREMDESGLGDDVSADETIAFWIVVIIGLAILVWLFNGVMDWKVWHELAN